MSGGPELHSRTRCETLAHRIEKMPTRDRLCEHCFPALKMPSRETEQWQLFSGRVLEYCLTTSQLVFAAVSVVETAEIAILPKDQLLLVSILSLVAIGFMFAALWKFLRRTGSLKEL